MDSRIQVLSPVVANLIAAGEVVERPASVVKELVENAIDAGAGEIRVEVEGGGLGRMTVRDDGAGMSAAEARLALERHATSKIRAAEDLAAIGTLGFRGEALPSMAAVSRFTLTTKLRGSGVAPGHRLQVVGGKIAEAGAIGCPEGTEITVRDLFFNTPARRKFLKAERTEFGHIQEMCERFALAYPTIRFALAHNGRQVFAVHTTTDLRQRVIELFGAATVDQLLPLTVTEGPIQLAGFCGSPSLARAGAQRVYCFVNRRPVRDRVLLHAVGEGYRTYLPKGENPLAVLCVTLDPDCVDVNVHPAKAEVRFANPGAIHQFVANAVRKTLATAGPTVGAGATGMRPGGFGTGVRAPAIGAMATEDSSATSAGAFPAAPPAVRVQETIDLHAYTQPCFRPLGQLATTYLLYEGPEGALLVIDQHAAHERIGFERLKAQLASGAMERQYCLTPTIVELSPAHAAAIGEAEALLAAAGLEVEPFGGTSVAVKAVPGLLGETDIAGLVTAIAAELEAFGRISALPQRIDHLLATMACHRQVRAGDRLTEAELAALVGDMTGAVSTDRCPHGRPTWIAIPRREIEKWFKR